MEIRLLTVDSDVSVYPSITLENKSWSLSKPLSLSSESNDLQFEYACISYCWGSGRVPNPIHLADEMSDHTLPALAAAIRNQDPDNATSMFWVDAFCVPVEPLAKAATLEHLGFIYGRASLVVVVLSNESFDAIEQMRHLDAQTMSEASAEYLDVLEQDAWIRSMWTYQEVINSQGLLFTGEGMSGKFISGETCLNQLGRYLDTWRRAYGHSVLDIREKYPHVDDFENLVLNWRVADFQAMSALQIIFQVDSRHWEKPSSIFYSMIRAITGKPFQHMPIQSIESLAETFMAACEDKGDYSFIYSSTERDERPGYGWRPALQVLHPLVPWHCRGNAQRGEKDPRGIRLMDMAILERSSTVGEQGKSALWRHLGDYCNLDEEYRDQTDTALANKLYSLLRRIGFTGSEQYLVTTHGYFFPQHPVASTADVVLWVSTSISWGIATPGMAAVLDGGQRRYIPGAFGGSVPEDGMDFEIPVTPTPSQTSFAEFSSSSVR